MNSAVASARRVLVAGPAWVGDMVMAQSLCMALKRREPDTEIDMLAPAWSLPLIARMPEVRRGVELPVGHGELGWSKRRRLGQSLRGEYDQAIVLPRSAKAALVPWFARIPVRTGFRGEMRFGLVNDMRRLDKTLLPQNTQRFVALGEPDDVAEPPAIQYPKLQVDADNQVRLYAQFGISGTHAPVAFMPGAEYGPAKRWPPRHFGVLARHLGKRGQPVIILGSAKERALGEQIAEFAPGACINLCGQTQLADVVDLLDGCAAAISNDSGLMHIAAAVDTRLIAIYGSSSPAYTPPLSDQAVIVTRDVACSPCFERECPLGHTSCLQLIAVADVLRHLDPEGLDSGRY